MATVQDAKTNAQIYRHPLADLTVDASTSICVISTTRGRRVRYQVRSDDVESAKAIITPQNGPLSSDPLGDAPEGVQRWQYAIVNIGAFKSVDRMQAMLARAGAHGWELAATMDKASNWWAGMEKGFLLLKRPVSEGAEPESWCIMDSAAGQL